MLINRIPLFLKHAWGAQRKKEFLWCPDLAHGRNSDTQRPECIFTHILYDHYNLWPALNEEDIQVDEMAAEIFMENVQVC